jgi:PAS domain S-box-containing protein
MNASTNFVVGSDYLDDDFFDLANFVHDRIESGTDAIIATDEDGDVFYLNVAAERLTGYPIDQVRGRPVSLYLTIINEMDRNQVDDPVTRCLLSNATIAFSKHDVLVSREGAEIPIGGCVTPIRRKDGRTIGVVLMLRDVTPTRLMLGKTSYRAQ